MPSWPSPQPSAPAPWSASRRSRSPRSSSPSPVSAPRARGSPPARGPRRRPPTTAGAAGPARRRGRAGRRTAPPFPRVDRRPHGVDRDERGDGRPGGQDDARRPDPALEPARARPGPGADGALRDGPAGGDVVRRPPLLRARVVAPDAAAPRSKRMAPGTMGTTRPVPPSATRARRQQPLRDAVGGGQPERAAAAEDDGVDPVDEVARVEQVGLAGAGPPPRTSTPQTAPSSGARTTVVPVSQPGSRRVRCPTRSPATSVRALSGPGRRSVTRVSLPPPTTPYGEAMRPHHRGTRCPTAADVRRRRCGRPRGPSRAARQ